MSKVKTLAAETRDKAGKGVARELRRQGRIPGIIYGGKEQPVTISIDQKDISVTYQKGGFFSNILELNIGNDTLKVLPRDIQLHPVTDIPQHVDFLRLGKDSKVNVMIKVEFLNRDGSPGLKRGGILNVVRREIELICSADNIPSVLFADLTGKLIGESIHISEIELPEGVEPSITDRDFTVATIVGRAAKEEDVTETAGEDAGAGDEESTESEEAAEGAEESKEGE